MDTKTSNIAKIHRITAPKTLARKLKKYIDEYYDPQKYLGYSKKKKKFVMKYPRKTYWRKYWARRKKTY